ncbi:tetratricopeptide repeat protein [Rickettsia endosymbiont of Aspidapion aeneum]|uniref:tetratricopeptide repeat protein n=1 Tax=Rickettsia endosymbiont of Aspidapion aeneum TaxID=3066247 RepID=UPI00313D7D2B
MKELIDFLEKKGFTAEANNLKNGATTLDLRNKNIGAEGAKAIAEGLKTNNSITLLQLQSNNIGAEGAKAIAEALKTNNSITQLNLCGNYIGDEGAKAIAEWLKTNNSITYLNLYNNKIGDEGAKAIGEGLKTNNSITQLNLRANQIGDEGAKAIAEAIKTNNTITQKTNNTITQLNLSTNQIGDEGAKALGEGLKTNNSITQLDINNNQIGYEGAKALGEGLKTNNSITQLYLDSNQIGYEGAKALGECLKTNNSITTLQLQSNKIGDKGAKTLGECLKTNNSITQLHLYNNQIGYEGAKALGECLKTNNSITSLELNSNQIGYEGAKALGECLKTNNSITSLELNSNQIGYEGAKALGEGLKTNNSITYLELGANKIEAEGIKQLQEYTQRNIKIAQEYNPQAEALNAQGNVLSNNGEYDKAIEKYNEAMAISKKPLYAKNKVNAEKNYAKQQAELVAKQKAELEAKQKAELLAKQQAELEAKKQAELLAKQQAELEAKKQAELLAKQQAELEAKKQAELLAQIQQEQQKIIQETMTLIAEGNDRITEKSDKGILILGKTGAGKSTLAYYLAKEELTVVKYKGGFRLQPKNDKNGIIVNHSMKSETKIPAKLIDTNGITIWDCPGFMDTREIAQEIANAFYIKRLFETSKQLKFILAIPDTLLEDKFDIIKPIFDQFSKTFTNTEPLKNSLSLIVTKADTNKKVIDIQETLNEISQQYKLTHPKISEILEILRESIYSFVRPTGEGNIPNSDLLEAIEDNTEYVDLSTTPNLANISISDEADKCAKDLLQITYNNINQLLGIFTKAISDPNKCMTGIKGNTFIDSYSIVESLPKSSTSEKNASFDNLPLHGSLDPFLKLDQIKSLQEKLFENLSNNNSNSIQNIFQNVLKVFAEFVINNNKLKQKIQDYDYVFKQQIDINKCFSEVCGNKPVYNMEQDLQECKEKIEEALKREIKLLEVEDGKINAENGEPDIAYYTKAVEYLDIYKDDQNCIKQKAKAYKNLGNIYDAQGDYIQAATNYTKALEMNKELPEIYERLGEMLFEKKHYKEAIKFLKVKGNVEKIKECFEKLTKASPNDPNLIKDKADYIFSIEDYGKAMKYYNIALYHSLKDDNLYSIIGEKIVNFKTEKSKNKAQIIEFIKSGEKYHYNEVNVQELNNQFIEKMKEPIQNLPIEQTNLVPIPCNDNHEVHINGGILDSHIS